MKGKVLIYAYPHIGQNLGGLQIQIRNTAEHLRQVGYEVKYFNQWEDKIEDYDIFHCFYLGDIGVLPLLKRAKESGVKIIMSTVYNSALDYLKEKITYQLSKISPSVCYVKNIQKQMVLLVDYFLALSDFEKQRIIKIFHIDERKVKVIPNGIDDMFINVSPKKENEFTKEYKIREYVLHVGQFNKNKNQIALIKALKDTNIPLVCIGQVTDKAYYEECVKIKGSNMIFLDPLPNGSDKLVNIYSAARIFVLPSIREAYPLTVLEAMACGTKVLVTKNSMIGSELDTFGVIKVNAANNAEIKRSVERMYWQHEDTQEKRKFEKEKFSWKEIVKEIDFIYQEALNEKKNN